MIAAIILAAGASRRMGEAKALLQIGGKTLLSRVASTARQAGAAQIVVAIGPPHGEKIEEQLKAVKATWAWNAAPERGMLSSVQAALPLLAATARGALIWPVDVPFVAVATVEALLDGDPCRMLIPTHKGKGGHPLWLPKELFAETLALTPETGLRALRDRHPPVRVEVEDAEVLHDLDTPEALMQARSYWG